MAPGPHTRLDEVRELAASGHPREALRGYRALCERDPYDPDLWLERAGVAEAAGLAADAIAALLHVLDLYAETGMAEAIDVAERVLELDPAHERARGFLELYAPDRNPGAAEDAGGEDASEEDASEEDASEGAGDGAELDDGDETGAPAAIAGGERVRAPARASTAPESIPEAIWDSVPMHVPSAASLPVAVPLLEAVPMPTPASDSVAMPAPRPGDLSAPVALPRLARVRGLSPVEPAARGLSPVEVDAPGPSPVELGARAPSPVEVDAPGPRATLADLDSDARALPPLRPRRHRTANHLIAGLRSSPLLDVLDQNALELALDSGQIRQLQRGESVVRQGERGDSLFLVLEGSVDVERYHPVLGMIVRLSTLTAGAFFGEQALVAGVARSATVRARRETTVLELGRDTVLTLARMNDQVLVTLMRFFRARLVGTLMATSPLFHPFSADERRAMVDRLRLRELPPQEIVLRQGRVADGLYVVLIGTLVAFVNDERGRARRLGVLGPGDVFGEMSLIRGEPAMASIGTHTRSWILRLPREDFREVVAGHPEVLDQLAEIAAMRQARNRDVLERED